MTDTINVMQGLEEIAEVLLAIEQQLGYTVNLALSRAEISSGYRWSCHVPNPDPERYSPIYGWGSSWQEAYEEASRHRKLFEEKMLSAEASAAAEAIRERHRRLAEQEIKEMLHEHL